MVSIIQRISYLKSISFAKNILKNNVDKEQNDKNKEVGKTVEIEYDNTNEEQNNNLHFIKIQK